MTENIKINVTKKLIVKPENLFVATIKPLGNGALPRRLRGDMDHARRVGWRIIKDWTDSQMAILETQMVKIQEIFLPYAYDMQNQETFYEKLEKKKFQGLLLQNNSEVS